MEYELVPPLNPYPGDRPGTLLLGWLLGLTQTLGPHLTLWCGAQNEGMCREVVRAGKLDGITVQVHPYLSERLAVSLTILEDLIPPASSTLWAHRFVPWGTQT